MNDENAFRLLCTSIEQKESAALSKTQSISFTTDKYFFEIGNSDKTLINTKYGVTKQTFHSQLIFKTSATSGKIFPFFELQVKKYIKTDIGKVIIKIKHISGDNSSKKSLFRLVSNAQEETTIASSLVATSDSLKTATTTLLGTQKKLPYFIKGELESTIINNTFSSVANDSNSQVTLNTEASSVADTYNGKIITIIDGTGIGQVRTITNYTNTKIATVYPDYVTKPDTTSKYFISDNDLTQTYEFDINTYLRGSTSSDNYYIALGLELNESPSANDIYHIEAFTEVITNDTQTYAQTSIS